MKTLFDRIADLPLTIESASFERLDLSVSPGWVRITTVVQLAGSGVTGAGEDVTYEEPDQVAQMEAGPSAGLSGRHTIRSFSRLLDGVDLFPAGPTREDSRDYRRWAFESAALDIALRQAGMPLSEALGRSHDPLRFVVSTSLGEPPSLDRIKTIRARSAAMGFKLDPRGSWDTPFLREVSAIGCVTVLDLKGAYKGTPVDQAADPALYARVLDNFPEALIEDPTWNDSTESLLRPHADRITWDAPIHSVADVEAMPNTPRVLNIKPSRFGTIERLLAAYEHCESQGVAMYGGGQFELGPGRGQIQYLASLFHPDGPNDVAPAGYNVIDLAGDLPGSPLTLSPSRTGFGLEPAT